MSKLVPNLKANKQSIFIADNNSRVNEQSVEKSRLAPVQFSADYGGLGSSQKLVSKVA